MMLILLCVQACLACDLRPSEALYKTNVNGFSVKVTRRLNIQGAKITVSVDARKFLFGVHETSILVDHGNGLISPVRYEHKRRGLSHRHDKELVFDWTANTVRDLLHPDRETLGVPNPGYDKLSYQTQMRLDLLCDPDAQELEYAVTNGIRNRTYIFHRLGEEVLDTPIGSLRTIRFAREGGDDDRQVVVWVAPDWGFLLVRLDQTREPGGKVERLMLRRAKVAGRVVEGLSP